MAELLDSYVELLLHFDGVDAATTDIDYSGQNHVLTFVGNAQLDTSQKRLGPSALLLDGIGDYVSIPDSPSWAFVGVDFTLDFWVRFSSLTGYQTFMGQWDSPGPYWFLYKTDTNKIHFAYRSFSGGANRTDLFSDNAVFTAINTWYNVEFVRSGNTAYMFVDGILVPHTVTNPFQTMENSVNTLKIGAQSGAANLLSGRMDELRISKGIGRHTASFTPNTYPYHRIAEIHSF